MIAAVVLAAGFSRRLGHPKQLVEIGGETLLVRALRIAGEAGLSPVIAVVQPGSGLYEVVEQWGAVAALNADAEEGLASSLRVGVAFARELGATGAVILTCDQVAVTVEHLCLLCADDGEAVGSAYSGKVGIPAYFPAGMFAELMKLTGDAGARELLRGARSVATEALAFDVDTEEDVVRARELLG